MTDDRCDVCGGPFLERVPDNRQSGTGGGGASYTAWFEPGRGLVQVCSDECAAVRTDEGFEPADAFLSRWFKKNERFCSIEDLRTLWRSNRATNRSMRERRRP